MGLLLCLLLVVAGGDGPAPLESGDVREVHVSAPAKARVEHFLLRRSGSEAPYAVARFVRWPLERGGERLELETRFLGTDHVISHVERVESGRRLLSWRERTGSQVRGVFLDGGSRGDGALRGWVGEGLGRRRLEVPGSVQLPLEWLGRALDGRAAPGTLELFEPLAAGTRRVTTERANTNDVTRWSFLEEGRVAERFELADGELRGFVWRSNHVRASRISLAEHAEHLTRSSS